jgi:hypothetical protein
MEVVRELVVIQRYGMGRSIHVSCDVKVYLLTDHRGKNKLSLLLAFPTLPHNLTMVYISDLEEEEGMMATEEDTFFDFSDDEGMQTAEEDLSDDDDDDESDNEEDEEDDQTLEPLSYTVLEDKLFVELANKEAPQGDSLRKLLHQAYMSPSTHKSCEDHKGSISALRKLGLVAVRTTIEDEASSDMDRFLCSSLMDYHNAHPGVAPNTRFSIEIAGKDTPCTIDIPCRSHLVSSYLAQSLQVNIFIFTNRQAFGVFVSDNDGGSWFL